MALAQNMATWARAAATGITSVVSVAVNEGISILSDEYGRLWTRIFVNGAALSTTNPLPVFVTSSSSPLTWVNASAMAASGVIKNAAGELFICYGFSTYTTAKGYFQIFNKASAPAGADVPVESIPVGVATTLQDSAFALGPLPAKDYSLGISWGFSSTPATYTAIAGNNIWVDFGIL